MSKKPAPSVILSGDKLYECGDCGTRFIDDGNGRQCPDCNKFAGKVSDHALPCPHCDEPIDLEAWS